MRNLLILTLTVLLGIGCAKNRDVERVRPGDRDKDNLKEDVLGGVTTYNKDGVLGKQQAGRSVWWGKMTVVNTSDSPSGTLFIGYQGDVKVGYFDFTPTHMQFRSINGLLEGRETENLKNPVILSWPIEHVDYILDQRDGMTTNQEIKDNFKTWDQKKYFTLKGDPGLANITQMLPVTSFDRLSCWKNVSARYTKLKLDIETNHIGYDVEAVYQRDPLCSNNKQWNEGDFNFTVTYRFSFRKTESSDYKIKWYAEEQDEARYKYGHFQTIKKTIRKTDGQPHNKFLENRWAEKTHYFYFVKGFPEKYKWIWDHTKSHSVFAQTNSLLKGAGSKLRFEIYDYNYNHESKKNDGPERKFGDLRYSFINFIEELEAGGTPLGYGPSDTDPFTGEIIAANSMVWTGNLDFYMNLMDKVGVAAQQESSLLAKFKAALQVTSSDNVEIDKISTHWDQSQGVGRVFRHMAQKSRFGFPSWNGYTADQAGRIEIPTYVEKFVDNSDNRISSVDFLGVIEKQPVVNVPFKYEIAQDDMGHGQIRVRNPYQVIDLSWLERLSKSTDPKIQAAVNGMGIHGILKMFQNVDGSVDPKGKGTNAANLNGLMQEHYKQVSHRIRENQEGHCVMDINEFAGGLAGVIKSGKLDIKSRQDFLNTVLYRVSIHEFGHNLNLRHNFYGSIDKHNFRVGQGKGLYPGSNGLKQLNANGKEIKVGYGPGGTVTKRKQISSSVMDYLRLEDEVNTPWAWEDYDVAAILDSYAPGGFDDKGHLYLFCTDEHTLNSAICNRHDLGTTPSEILMSQIRSYDERYIMRNNRFGRAYWNTAGYTRGIYDTMLSMKEFLAMWRTAYANDLISKQMDTMGIGTTEQTQYLEELNREMRKVMKLSMGFYQAVIQQSRGDRDFRSEYDDTTGALKRLGIISDKIFSMLFLAGDDALYYNPDRIVNHTSYLTHSREDGELAEFSEQFWRNIVTTRNPAMEPWFINFARLMYAKNATNYNNGDFARLIDDMKVIRVENASDLKDQFDIEMDPSSPIFSVELTKDTGGNFHLGTKVSVLQTGGKFYLTSTDNRVANALFLEGLNKLTGGGGTDDITLQEFTMDVREFYWLYDLAKQGALR